MTEDAVVTLRCSIAHVGQFGLDYEVRDPSGDVVAHGHSSNEHWMEHDAGGYHTQQNFDARYGEGNWRVEFDFSLPA